MPIYPGYAYTDRAIDRRPTRPRYVNYYRAYELPEAPLRAPLSRVISRSSRYRATPSHPAFFCFPVIAGRLTFGHGSKIPLPGEPYRHARKLSRNEGKKNGLLAEERLHSIWLLEKLLRISLLRS